MTGTRTLWIAIALGGLALGCQREPAAREATVPSATSAEAPAATATPNPASAASSTAASSLTLVTDRSLVCMVNNQFMGRPQIPIEVDGRTYFGCCEMCKGRLGSDPTSRVATDPVTRNTVDKATATIGRTSDGRTFYFENEQTFAAYASGAAR